MESPSEFVAPDYGSVHTSSIDTRRPTMAAARCRLESVGRKGCQALDTRFSDLTRVSPPRLKTHWKSSHCERPRVYEFLCYSISI